MENFSYHVPVYVVTGGVATSGHSADLTGGKIGLFDRATFSIATGVGNGKEFYFAQGNIGGKDWYAQPVKESHKSPFFYGKDVKNMYSSAPKRIQNEEWVIGFNGSPSSKSLTYEAGVPTRIKLYFHGQPIYRFFAGPKEYVVSYTPPVSCGEPCNESDCPDGISDCLTHTQKLVELINTHTELQKFGVNAQLVNTPYTATTATKVTFTLSVCDTGDVLALLAVQAAYPTLSISRVSRDGATSVYETCVTAGVDVAPADFGDIEWVEGDEKFTGTRTLIIKNVLGADRLSDIEDVIAAVPGVDVETLEKVTNNVVGACSNDYTVDQASTDCLGPEACLSNLVSFNFADLPAFENNAWEVVPATVVENANRKCGIRITAGYIDPQYGNCSFTPSDYYETMPIKMEVSLLQEDGSACDAADWPTVQQTKVGQISRQSGEYVAREVLMKTQAYLKHVSQFSLDSREREAFDMQLLNTVDRSAFYKLYYVTYKASYGNSFRKNEQETFTTVFAFKETDTAAIASFETNVIGVLTTKSGVALTTNA
jgi:hypothetical protein